MKTEQKTGAQLRDEGMQRATENADQKIPSWSERAFDFLLFFIAESDGPFKIEEVREAAKDRLEDPPSNRAWGTVARRAAKGGFMKRVGVAVSENPKHHRGFVSVWKCAV